MINKYFIVCLFILNSIMPSFAFVIDHNDFKTNWNYSPIIKRIDGTSELQMKLFKKSLWINKTEIPIVETTFTYLKNPKETTDLKKLAFTIQKSFDVKNLVVTNKGNQYKIEGPYKKLNRFVKIELKNIDNKVLVVTSFIRLGFYKKTKSEVDNLHQTLLTYRGASTENKTTWIKWLQHFALKDAFADGITIDSIINGTNITRPPEATINLNLQTGGMQNSVDGLSNQLGNTNNQIGNTNLQLGNANNNWNNTNNQIGNANANLGDFNKEYGSMNTNWAESNKIMAETLDPNHMTKVAFYTAAGAALGGVAVNLAIQGVSSGISFLYELFTGTKKKKLEWDDLEKAMSVWDTQLNDLVKLEQAVDAYLAAFEFFEGKNLSNDYVKQLANVMRDMRFDRDIFMENFKDQNLSTSCRKIYYNAADELDQKLKEYDRILQFAEKNNINNTNNSSYFCNQLKELQRKILSAENQMQDLRLKILMAENQFYGKRTEDLENRDEKLEDINDKLDKTLKEKKKYDEKVVERLKDSHEANKTSWSDACLDGKNEAGEKINKEFKGIFGGVFTYFKRKELCGLEYEKISKDLIARDEKSIATLKTEEDFRKDLNLKANNFVDLKLSEEQMSWMTRLHVDAYCFQFAHQSEDKIPPKCKDFPELLYSMSLSRGHEKAKNAYDQKCQDRYLSGLKNIAASEVVPK